MKPFVFLLFILTQVLTLSAQHADKLMISDEGWIELYTKQGYTSKFEGNKFPFQKKFHVIITDQSSGEIREEFFRYSDSCLAYVQYDSNRNEIAKGLICINTNRRSYDTISVPDIEKDPDLSKGITKDYIFTYFYFDKTGAWEEKESPLVIRRGVYEYGKKTGLWKVGYYAENVNYPYHSSFPIEIFYVECTEKYVDNHSDSTYQPDYSFSKIWNKLKGAWSLSTLESIHGIQYKYIKSSSPNEASLIFIDSLFFKQGASPADKNIKWKLDNNAMYRYYSKDDIKKYRIDYLSTDELYLTPLRDEEAIKRKRK
ncbi:MAG: hypothetical protein IT249_09520 [Chitinophagaceae bacterium]|nr:hypothetical protein [Chitinophagaceae bacterium]